MRLGTNGRARAARSRASRAGARTPTSSTSAATPRCAATTTCRSSATRAFFANAELRFPLIEAMLTPIGVLGGIRGVFFANFGGAGFTAAELQVLVEGDDHRAADRSASSTAPDGTTIVPVYGDPLTVSGFRLQDGRASYGVGLESFLLGFPIHFDCVVADAVQQAVGRRCSSRPRAAAASSARASSSSGLATTSRGASVKGPRNQGTKEPRNQSGLARTRRTG